VKRRRFVEFGLSAHGPITSDDQRRPILRDNLPVLEITTAPGQVSGWSEVRLPFEPKGEMLRFRQQLVAAIKVMPPACDGQLVATYTAANPKLVI
jgi:hypothetical protein